MKPRPSLPQREAAALIEGAAQSHSGAREHDARKPNPFKADPLNLIGSPEINRKSAIRETHLTTENGQLMAEELAKLWNISPPPCQHNRRKKKHLRNWRSPYFTSA